MIVPLIGEAHHSTVYITSNRQIRKVKMPFKPYLIAAKENKFLKATPVKATRIPDGITQDFFKMEYDDIQKLTQASHQLITDKVDYHKLPYMEQLYIDQEDFMLGYPNTNDLKVMYLDIEVLTKGDGIFPRASKSPIIAIGCAVDKDPVVIFDGYEKAAGKKADKNILEQFMGWMRDQDPDIVVTYNGTWFDMPYILERLQINTLDSSQMNRFNGPVTIEEEKVVFRGRLHFDPILNARKDQSLMGIKSKGLKHVAKWYGFDAKDFGEDITNTQKYIGTPEMREYLTSDVNATRHVAGVYLPLAVTLAEMMKVPLSAIVGSYSSFVPKIVCGRHYKALDLVALDNNVKRYGDVERK